LVVRPAAPAQLACSACTDSARSTRRRATGGVVACDGGGARALRHGTARGHVAGLEAALADGSVISRLPGLTKDDAGYDLPALLVGSEGTLGIVTRVRWRLAPLLSSRVAAPIRAGSAREAAELLAAVRVETPSLESC
jgi:FAD/FMN-containing dehydrogenase